MTTDEEFTEELMKALTSPITDDSVCEHMRENRSLLHCWCYLTVPKETDDGV